jgi:hypothetical protein
MKAVDIDEIADELYGLHPDDFTKARDAAARAASDSATTKAIKALRKPTASAYAVNRLVRDRADEVDELLALGDDLRTAMAGRGGDVRELTEQRRALVRDLVDSELSAAVQADVTATLEAATADPELAAAVRSGRLIRPLRYAGFGALPDVTEAVATPLKPAGKRIAANKRAAAKPARESPKPAELDAARRRALDLAGAADDAQHRYDAAVRAAVEARERLDVAEAERAEAHRAARAAHAEAEKARRELGRLERS